MSGSGSEFRPAENPEFRIFFQPGKLVSPRGKPIRMAAGRLPPGETPGVCLVTRIEKTRPPPCFFVIRDFALVFPWGFPWGKPVFPWGKPGGMPRKTSRKLLFRHTWFSPGGNQGKHQGERRPAFALVETSFPGFHQAFTLVSKNRKTPGIQPGNSLVFPLYEVLKSADYLVFHLVKTRCHPGKHQV